MPKVQTQILEADPQVNAEVSQLRQTWLKEGRCPECGELGRLDAFGGARCSVHGIYSMMVKPLEALPGADPEDFLRAETVDE